MLIFGLSAIFTFVLIAFNVFPAAFLCMAYTIIIGIGTILEVDENELSIL